MANPNVLMVESGTLDAFGFSGRDEPALPRSDRPLTGFRSIFRRKQVAGPGIGAIRTLPSVDEL